MRSATILLVDDDDAIRRVMRTMLELNGYRVLDCGFPLAACELFDSDPAAIDLLLTDVKMPVMSGHALAARLATVRPDLPVVFVSGYLDVTSLGDLQGPQHRVLAKPFDADVLLETVSDLLSACGR